jgi:hypothetical protein
MCIPSSSRYDDPHHNHLPRGTPLVGCRVKTPTAGAPGRGDRHDHRVNSKDLYQQDQSAWRGVAAVLDRSTNCNSSCVSSRRIRRCPCHADSLGSNRVLRSTPCQHAVSVQSTKIKLVVLFYLPRIPSRRVCMCQAAISPGSSKI